MVSLVPGEEVQVQVAVKCANIESPGHWSHWSDPVRDVVPQGAGVLRKEERRCECSPTKAID